MGSETIFLALQANEKIDLEAFFDVLRRRKAYDGFEVTERLYKKIQEEGEDEEDVLYEIIKLHKLRLGGIPGALSDLSVNERVQIKTYFMRSIADRERKLRLQQFSDLYGWTLEDLVAKARHFRTIDQWYNREQRKEEEKVQGQHELLLVKMKNEKELEEERESEKEIDSHPDSPRHLLFRLPDI